MTLTIPILAPILAFIIIMEPNSHPFHQAAAVGLVVVNMMWFFKFMTKYWHAASQQMGKKMGTSNTPRKESVNVGVGAESLMMSPTGAGGSGTKME
jgi:hypothetical protein